MNRLDALHENSGRVRSRMGGAFIGRRAVFRGHDLHADLGDIDWVELYTFGITGRRFNPHELKLLHALWVYTSYPDARIWNNRVAALAATTRSSGNLGISAALAVSEAMIYGRGIDIRASGFLQRTREAMSKGAALEDCVRQELKTHRSLAGYGRPIASGDERIAPMMDLARRLGLDQGPHLKLAYDVERFLLEGRWRWRMNYAALVAALTADLGMSPQEHYRFTFPTFLAGMQPCFIEAAEQPAGTLLPLSCEQLSYTGPQPRTWGRAAGAPAPCDRSEQVA